MEQRIEKIKTLFEALPYIKKFKNKTIVIKFGGNAMVKEELKESFARDIVLMKYVGMNPVIVHGGGPQIEEQLNKLGIETKFKKGIRVTDDATMDVVEMVLVGKVNKDIVGLINHHGGRAVGLSGKDGSLVKAGVSATKASRVGTVSEVNPEIIDDLDKSGFIPVIAPVGEGPDGKSYNINADLVAGAIATALEAEKLILLTDVQGVLDSKGKLISNLSTKDSKALITKKVASGGMIPKLKCAVDAVDSGVHNAHIIDGRVEHSVLLEVFTDKGIGTIISKAKKSSVKARKK